MSLFAWGVALLAAVPGQISIKASLTVDFDLEG